MKRILILCCAAFLAGSALAQRHERLLTQWQFHKGETAEKWENVIVPHDWAIKGPFDRNNDLQRVAVFQNGENEATEKTGRTGGLPYVGIGWYKTTFRVNTDNHRQGGHTTLVFDGAMSEAHVYVNGKEMCFWPYGYNSFSCDVTDAIKADADNELTVRLENVDKSSRWYSGAGLYRNVHLIETRGIHVPVWGTHVTTPVVTADLASVDLATSISGISAGDVVTLYTEILSDQGRIVNSKSNTYTCRATVDETFAQHFAIENPDLWSPDAPHLYKAITRIYKDGQQQDTYTTRFGIRSIDFVADKGFFLNGTACKFQGVCLHHDLGPLGAAVNKSAIRHQLEILKDMGCNAIRTSHNMPAPELVELCEEMGFMMMLEPFDEWDIAKCDGGYHRWFNALTPDGKTTWAEADMVNMLRHYRNSPAVVMWSVGNEVPTQCDEQGYRVAAFLRNICHREDATRPVTCGMDQVDCVLSNGFAAQIDIPGFNYRAHRYDEAYNKLPQNIVLGSETASTVSSRGVYKFPVTINYENYYADHQSSSYDTEYCSWANTPDLDFANADDKSWEIGQFVWTGFDYLGEPSPYDTDAWPSHSSLFGIVDLASIPKDRYYLYRSQWNKQDHTLHILPHWTWPGREGEVTPIYVYTDAPEAELVINGKSQGRRHKATAQEAAADAQAKIEAGKNRPITGWAAGPGDANPGSPDLRARYRLMWDDVVYEPGEVFVKAFYPNGDTLTTRVRTAGKPHHIEVLGQDGHGLEADGTDLYYLTIRIVDKEGNLCPDADNLVKFKVTGDTGSRFRACANGDATCVELFHLPQMHAFHGKLTAIVQAGNKNGIVTLTATAAGLKSGKASIAVGGYKAPNYVKGADIGDSSEMAAKGMTIYNEDGKATEMTQLMKDYGCSAIRCRVWIDPAAKGHGHWCDKQDVLEKCLRAKALGMDVMIDFHYSDWWCDPGKQPIPLSWSGKPLAEVKDSLRAHTLDVLRLLKSHGITPKWVQVGNETTYGFLWSVREDASTGWPLPGSDGKNIITEAMARIDRPGKHTHNYAPGITSEGGAKAYAELFATGYDAVKEVFPKAQVIVHLDDGFDQELFDWNLGILRDNGAKWDIIGMSLYTYWAINEGKRTDADAIVDECIRNINHLYEKFGTPSMLVEVGMDALSPDDGSRILTKILRDSQSLTNGHCLGAFYWDPACRPSQYRLGAFDEAGYPTAIMRTFRDN